MKGENFKNRLAVLLSSLIIVGLFIPTMVYGEGSKEEQGVTTGEEGVKENSMDNKSGQQLENPNDLNSEGPGGSNPNTRPGTPLTSLGSYKSYNAVVFGNHLASHADIEGKLAVAGNINAPTDNSSFTIAAAFPGNYITIGNPITDFTNPTFLLGGKINDNKLDPSKKLYLSAGTAVLTNNTEEKLLFPADKYEGTIKKSTEEVQSVFNKMKSDINDIISKVKKIKAGDGNSNNNVLNVVPSLGNKDILTNSDKRTGEVLNFYDETTKALTLPKINGNERLIVYSEGKVINFRDFYYEGKLVNSNNKGLMHYLAPKILWVFPNATEINSYRGDVPGSIIAPNATVNLHGGSINGQVFVNNLKQIPNYSEGAAYGGEIHNFTFDWDIIDKTEPPKGSITVKKEIIDKDGNVIAESVINKDDSFSISIEGDEKYTMDLKGNQSGTISFYLKDKNSDINGNGDLSLNYLSEGKYKITEIVPMNYKLLEILVEKDGPNTNSWIKIEQWDKYKDGKFTIDKDNLNFSFKVRNQLVNKDYWQDKDHVINSITVAD